MTEIINVVREKKRYAERRLQEAANRDWDKATQYWQGSFDALKDIYEILKQ